MSYQISLPQNCYLIKYKDNLIGLKYFDYDYKAKEVYDRDSVIGFKYHFVKWYSGNKEPYLSTGSIMLDTKFSYFINILSGSEIETEKIEQNEKCGIVISPFDNKELKVPFLMDVNITNTAVIRLPVMFNIKEFVKIIGEDVFIKGFSILPPEEIKLVSFPRNIKLNTELYEKIYNMLLNK